MLDKPLAILSHGMVSPQGREVERPLPQGIAGPTQRVLEVENVPDRTVIRSAEARRASRSQLLGLAAVRYAMQPLADAPTPDPARCGVYVGTGLGGLDQTLAFVDNMIRRQEQWPAPAKFVNSVHNAVASQLAIALGYQGPNHSFPHDAMSFELALQQAALTLWFGDIDQAVVVGVDALDPHYVAVGQQHGWWDDTTLPGEGAAAFVLRRGEDATSNTMQLRRSAWQAQPPAPTNIASCDALVLPETSAASQRLERALAQLANGPATFHTQPHTGRLCTASALGLATAVDLLHQHPNWHTVNVYRAAGPHRHGMMEVGR